MQGYVINGLRHCFKTSNKENDMIYAGIDIGKNEHGFAVVKDRNNKFVKPRMIKNDIEGLTQVISILKEHEPDPKDVIIGMEATGHFWRPAANFFKTHGYQVDVFNPIVSAKREQQSVRGSKSDKSSAVAIAKVVRDDDYSVYNDRSDEAEQTKALLRQRSNLVDIRTALTNRIIAYWDVSFPELQSHLTTDQLATLTGLGLLEKFACAKDIAEAHLTSLKAVLKRITNEDKTKAIRESARHSIGLDNKVSYMAVLSDVRMFKHVRSEIRLIEKQLAELESDQTKLLKSMPGIGPITSASVMSSIGDFDEFRKKSDKPLHNRILAFAGAEPRIRSSGKFVGQIKMSKRGDKHLRHALFMAADSARRCCPYFKSIYDRQKLRGKHHYVAVSHVMRKMVVIATAMLKNNEEFSLEKLGYSAESTGKA
jgi:transposase